MNVDLRDLEAQVERQVAHEVLGDLVRMGQGPIHRLLAEIAIVLGHVGAPAVLEVAGDGVVVVAVDRGDRPLLDQGTDLVG